MIRFVSKITDVRLTAFLFVLIIVFLGTVLDAVTLLGDVDARSVPARVLVALETRCRTETGRDTPLVEPH